MVLFKGRRSLVLLVCTLLVLCCTVSVAKEDPEVRQCKHQCRHQRQFDSKQIRHCERECEKYIEEKEKYQREERERETGHIGEEDENYKRRDPEREYRKCRERCQEEEQGRREQQLCESECEKRRQEEKGERGREEVEMYRMGERQRSQDEGEEEVESGNPYVFQDEHFTTKFKTQEGRVRVLQKFTKRSKLFKGVENFRVMIFEANPQTFIIPNHWDADAIFFVAQGRGTVSLVYTDRRESFNIERGHVMVIPAGVTAYMINRDKHEKLILAKLINPVANPGKFVSFFGPGGEDPESFFNVFSPEVLEAAFQTSRDTVQRIFSQQREGVIIRASKEQIRAMTHEEGTRWPFAGKGSRESGPFHLLRQRPKESNEFGKLFEADLSDNRQLQDLGVSISFANITQGSMHTPYYNSRATKVAIVLNGRGYFEMACPHVSGSGRSQQQHQRGGRTRRGEGTTTPIHYEKISSELRPGTVFVVPAGHPFITMASQNENLEVICFEINAENNHKFPLAGQKNIMRNFEREAKQLAFATSAEEVDRVLESQEEEFFFRGPRQHRRQGITAY